METFLHTINLTKHSHSVLNVVKMAAKRKICRSYGVPVLRFTIPGQQITSKSVRFWQLLLDKDKKKRRKPGEKFVNRHGGRGLYSNYFLTTKKKPSALPESHHLHHHYQHHCPLHFNSVDKIQLDLDIFLTRHIKSAFLSEKDHQKHEKGLQILFVSK